MSIGDKVEKIGDYHALGEIRAIFTMTTGALRFVVEHQAEGGGSFCHIYSEKNIKLVSNQAGVSHPKSYPAFLPMTEPRNEITTFAREQR